MPLLWGRGDLDGAELLHQPRGLLLCGLLLPVRGHHRDQERSHRQAEIFPLVWILNCLSHTTQELLINCDLIYLFYVELLSLNT